MTAAPRPGRARTTLLLDRVAGRLRRPTVLVGALVGAVALVRILPVAAIEDLVYNDDASYLRQALGTRSNWPRGGYSPVLEVWYRIANWAFANPVRVQFVTFLLFGAALGLVTYILALALGAPRGPAALAALVVTATALPTVRPTIGTFAAVILWSTVAVAWRSRRRSRFWPILTAGVVLVTWTRPEFFVALVAVVGLAVASVFVGPRAADRRGPVLAAGACLLLVGVAWVGFGSPVAGNRQWVAFCQHEGFARQILDDRTSPNPWIGWRATCRSAYGTDASIPAAMVDHPHAVAAHVGRSLRLLPASTRDALLQQPTRPGRVRSLIAATVGAGLIGSAVVVAARRRRSIVRHVRSAGRPGVALGALLVPSVVAIVVIHPRFHYLSMPTVLAVAVAAVVVGRSRSSWGPVLVVSACAALGLVITGTAVLEASAPPPRPGLDLVTELQRRADTTGLHRVAPIAYDLTGYLTGVEAVPLPDRPGHDVPAWLEQHRIDGVLAPAGSSDRGGRVTSAAVAAFLDHPERAGWRAVDLGSGLVLYLPAGADG